MDGTPDDRRERARALVERATHGSVTEEILLGEGQFSNSFYLYDRPAIDHLDDGELVHFAFYNEMKGIGVGGKRDTRTPDEGGVTVILLTDRRVLAVIGRREADERLAVPYDVVTGADYSTGIMKSRIAVETRDTTYHLWIDSGYDEAALEAAADFVAGAATGGTPAPSGPGADPEATTTDGGDPAGPSAGAGTGSAASSVPGGGSDDGATGGDGDDDPLAKLERLQKLRERGAITEAEFEEKKRELMDRI